MDQAQRVDVVQRARQLQHQIDDLLARGALEIARDVVAADELLREVERVGVAAATEVVHRREVGMVQLREQPELFLERRREVVGAQRSRRAEAPRDHAALLDARVLRVAAVGRVEARARGAVPADELERDHAIFELVVRLVDRAEASAPEQAAHLVATGDALGRVVLERGGLGLRVRCHREDRSERGDRAGAAGSPGAGAFGWKTGPKGRSRQRLRTTAVA
ncbi:MAG: hypothetical protein U0168_06825 [Nannocystaceae bacterium]